MAVFPGAECLSLIKNDTNIRIMYVPLNNFGETLSFLLPDLIKSLCLLFFTRTSTSIPLDVSCYNYIHDEQVHRLASSPFISYFISYTQITDTHANISKGVKNYSKPMDFPSL